MTIGRACFVFERSPVRISALLSAILSEIFRDCPQFSQANARMDLKLDHDRFLLHPFQFINHLSSLHSTLYCLELLKSIVTGKRFEPGTSRIRIRTVNVSTMTFGPRVKFPWLERNYRYRGEECKELMHQCPFIFMA
jgi:hypothetical protein